MSSTRQAWITSGLLLTVVSLSAPLSGHGITATEPSAAIMHGDAEPMQKMLDTLVTDGTDPLRTSRSNQRLVSLLISQ